MMPGRSTSTACLPRLRRARFPTPIVQKEDEAMKDPGRDTSIERMLERTLGIDPTGNACPDAEVLAAWTDRTLRGAEQASVESHVADCARCQTHLATMTRMASGEENVGT